MWERGFLQRGNGLKRVIDRLLPDSSGEEAHRTRILLVAGFIFAITGILLLFAQMIMWVYPSFLPPPASDLVVDFLVVLVGGLTVWLVRSGRIPLAAWAVIVSLFVIATAELLLEGRPPTDVAGGLGFFLVVVLAFVLLDRGRAWWVLAAAAASFIVIHVLWLGGVSTAEYFPRSVRSSGVFDPHLADDRRDRRCCDFLYHADSAKASSLPGRDGERAHRAASREQGEDEGAV